MEILLSILLGGFFGFALSYVGTCPENCVGQMGSNGIKKAISAILGGLVGAFTY